MRELIVDVPGAQLSADVSGPPGAAGPTVVALHGLGSSRASDPAGGRFGWNEVAAAGRRLVRYDARGHGRSSGTANPADYSWNRLADDLFRLLDTVAPGEPVDAIGVSMGVGTLLHAAVREPGRFRRLALVIPPTAWATRAAQSAGYVAMAEAVEQHGSALALRAMAAQPLPPLLDAAGVQAAPPDVADALLPSVLRGAGATDLMSPAEVGLIPVPVLLLPWTGDPGHPESTAERLNELLPDSTLELVETTTQLDALGGRVADFLR